MTSRRALPCPWPLLCLMALFLCSCVTLEQTRSLVPVKLEFKFKLEVPFKVEKALYDRNSNTLFLTEQNRPYIYFYRNDRMINQIGGLGSEHTNFLKLADIALDPDGNLLALDGFARLIRKFSPDGKWIADIEIKDFKQAEKLGATPDGNLLLFDSSTRELHKISALDGKTLYSFGRFQIDGATNITAARDMFAVFFAGTDETAIFSDLGQLLKTIPGQVVLDSFGNSYQYREGILSSLQSDAVLLVRANRSSGRAFASEQTLIVAEDSAVYLVTPVYQTQAE